MGNDEDRMSILEKIERGEISIEEAGGALEQLPDQSEAADVRAQAERKAPDEARVPTRRERKLALADKFHNWQPETMAGLVEIGDSSPKWPWSDKGWQWMWQNVEYPVYISHSVNVSQGTELKIVAYHGDLFICGWDEPTLRINGAVFDLRIGQDEDVIRVASSTGQLQVWLPDSITRLDTTVNPGDTWISSISADMNMCCYSGDLGCEQVKGNIKAQVNGGDARLMGIEGSIDANVVQGNTQVRGISSSDVNLRATEGDIWLALDSVSSGRFLCESDKGDVNLLTNGDLACELLVEATEGGRISPVIMPWQQLLERSEGKLHGILKSGGAFVGLTAHGGKIYIQESWMNTFAVPSPS